MNRTRRIIGLASAVVCVWLAAPRAQERVDDAAASRAQERVNDAGAPRAPEAVGVAATTRPLDGADFSAAPRPQEGAAANAAPTVALAPTPHPALPRELSQLWLAPMASAAPGGSNRNERAGRAASQPALDEFAAAVKLEVATDFAKALPILSKQGVQRGPLGDYAVFYKGLAELRLGRAADARVTFQALQSHDLDGYLVEASALREAECDEALGDQAAALAIYERLATMKTTMPDDVLLRVGRAAKAVGDSEKARAAFARVYYEFPFSDLSSIAATEMDNSEPIVAGSSRYRLELGRAERLFDGKKYAQARTAFETLRNAAQGDDRELVDLRLAESDYFLKRPRYARDGVRPYIDHASRQAEALFFYAVSSRELGDRDQYLKTIRRLPSDFPTQSWAEEALNNLGTYYILEGDDDQADQVFREEYEKFPTGRYAERAAWKIGWRAFKDGQYRDVVRVFERAAADFPRSDYRPSWLYWSARAHDALDERATAQARYTLVALDYLNSYYGRLAAKQLDGHVPERRLMVATTPEVRAAAGDSAPANVTIPSNASTIRALLGLKLYDQALDELRYVQKTSGDSPVVEATIAWIYRELGRTETGTQQFTHYRGAITIMRRAYPQFLAAGGESLPRDILRIIFPVGYWDLIRRHSAEHNLDPYLVAALMAQESTFVPDIRSPANAVGLMQLEAATARQYARRLNIRYSSRVLTDPETNIRIGTAYLADKVRQFGELHLVLASYNAGEAPVHRWLAERPGVPRDEFIDDIPYPETQNYVKRILGTAEDYRRLYGGTSELAAVDNDVDGDPPAASKRSGSASASHASAESPQAAGVAKAKTRSSSKSKARRKRT